MKSDKEIRALVSRLTVDEKISLLSGKGFWHTQEVERLGIPSIMVSDGPHGLRKQGGSGDHLGIGASLPATCFPPAVSLASSWDPALVRRVGEAIGEEARAEKVSVVLGPGVNIKRSPLCGRNFEYYSEDPLVAGEMAAAFIEGVQSTGVGTSIKHFAANNQEYHRLVNDSVIDPRTLREIYLPAFEKAVKRARPWTVMCSYNRINGLHASDNPWLLTQVLRREWGFDGLVMSDWGAVNQRVRAVRAGLDLEMPGNKGANKRMLRKAIARAASKATKGAIGAVPQDWGTATEPRVPDATTLDQASLDAAVINVLRLVFRSQEVLDHPWSWSVDAHHLLAREAAEESLVLLRNEDGVLPLERGRRVAVLGSMAVSPRYQGAGSSQIVPTRLDLPWDELVSLAAELDRGAVGHPETTLATPPATTLDFARGYHLDAETVDPSLEAEALVLADRAEVVVVFAGLPSLKESEGFDRTDLRLPDNQNHLIAALAARRAEARASGRPAPHLVVVLQNGGPVELPWAEGVDAILESYLGGQAGAGAVARTLFGLVTPSGRLAETFPRALEDNPSHPWFPGTPQRVEYREGLYVGYRYYQSAGVAVRYPFGYGLSYTSFAWEAAEIVQGPRFDADAILATLQVRLRVRNIGPRPGKDVVQLYVEPPKGAVYRPALELRAFAKTPLLQPGETADLVLTLDRRAFALWDEAHQDWVVEPGTYRLRLGINAAEQAQVLDLEVASTRRPQADIAPRPLLEPWFTARVAGTHRISDESFAALLGRPLPSPRDPREAFDFNATLGQISVHPLGRWIAKTIKGFSSKNLAGADPSMRAMVERSMDEMPFRGLVLMGNGSVSWGLAKLLLAIMNLGRKKPRN